MSTEPVAEDVTRLLADCSRGVPGAHSRLWPLVYDTLHRVAEQRMRRERRGHTLQPTALVHEAYLLLVGQTRVEWRDRAHFFAVASEQMRRVLLKHARSLRAVKRQESLLTIPLEESRMPAERPAVHEQAVDVIALDEALIELSELDERQAKIIELRFYGGLTLQETAQVLGVSPTTVKREARLARAWLVDRLERGPERR